MMRQWLCWEDCSSRQLHADWTSTFCSSDGIVPWIAWDCDHACCAVLAPVWRTVHCWFSLFRSAICTSRLGRLSVFAAVVSTGLVCAVSQHSFSCLIPTPSSLPFSVLSPSNQCPFEGMGSRQGVFVMYGDKTRAISLSSFTGCYEIALVLLRIWWRTNGCSVNKEEEDIAKSYSWEEVD